MVWLRVTVRQMESVERALAIRRTTSLDQLYQDGDGSTLHELIADPQNSTSLDQLDWALAAEALTSVALQRRGSGEQLVSGA